MNENLILLKLCVRNIKRTKRNDVKLNLYHNTQIILKEVK